MEAEQWYCRVVRGDAIVTEDLGPFESRVLALRRALNEYLELDQ
jgi:hypothetical protein